MYFNQRHQISITNVGARSLLSYPIEIGVSPATKLLNPKTVIVYFDYTKENNG